MTQELDEQRVRWDGRDEALARFGSEAVAVAERAYAIWLDEGMNGDDTLSVAVIAARLTREGYRAGQAAAKARVKELEAALVECAIDLEAEVMSRAYISPDGRTERDLQSVKRAYALLGLYPPENGDT